MDRDSKDSDGLDLAVVAAVAGGWIEAEAPPETHDMLFTALDEWSAEPRRSAARLWLTLLDRLGRDFRFDAVVSACRVALSLMPSQHCFRFLLARGLFRVGEVDAALVELEPVAALTAHNPEQMLLRIEIAAARGEDPEPLLALVEAWLAANPNWSGQHAALLRGLITLGRSERIGPLLAPFLAEPTEDMEALVDQARLALIGGDPLAARTRFEPLWSRADPALDLVVGRFDGRVRPYSAEIEAAILERIATTPDVADPPDDLGGDEPLPPCRVLLVGFESSIFPNDVVHHLRESCIAAGLETHQILDDALILGCDVRLTDAAIEARIATFEAEVERLRPELVLIEWCSPLTSRGLRPDIMARLKQRLGFRLIVSIRDAHAPALACMTGWLEAADTLLVFHPLSPILTTGDGRFADRVFSGWHAVQPMAPPPPFEGRPINLSFVGSVFFTMRNAILSVLLTEDLPFTAIFGDQRAIQLPDMAAYLGFLGQSRATLNISAHTNSEHLITGRVWEAAALGTLLLEQDNPCTRLFFTPWRHYLPWTTLDDIAQLCRFVHRNPGVAAEIAGRARLRAERRYSAKRLWRGLLAHARR
ncbi:glycosyltransferase [Paramagnetospirillum marisnigri]|nr:glycosyltransferase [Paramagnetospirillum marisnigri]